MWKTGIEVRKDMSATVLRKKARPKRVGKVASRMFGIANILDGMEREEAARLVGTTRHVLACRATRGIPTLIFLEPFALSSMYYCGER